MKSLKFIAGGYLSVLMGLLLPSLTSSIYIDPVKNTRSYPEVKVVIAQEQHIGGEAPRNAIVKQDIMVPLKEYNAYKARIQSPDPILEGYLDGTWGLPGDPENEPHLFVTISGQSELGVSYIVSKVVQMIPPEGAQDVICWLIDINGRKYSYLEVPTDERIVSIECAAFYFNKDYVTQYQRWLLDEGNAILGEDNETQGEGNAIQNGGDEPQGEGATDEQMPRT